MRTDYISEEILMKILWVLMPPNAMVCRTMIDTGMRISDCLAMERDRLFTPENDLNPPTYTYIEQKTGKERVAHLTRETYLKLKLQQSIDPPSPFVFPGRNPEKPRTRQAVWKDLHRAAEMWRVNGKKLKAKLGTHTMRKVYAVKLFHAKEDEGLYDPLHYVQVDMNHKDPAVTFIYAMADIISKRREA